MSWRLFIIAGGEDPADPDFSGADVVLREGEDVAETARLFANMPGPNKLFTPSREHETFRALVKELADVHGMEEDNDLYNFEVLVTPGKLGFEEVE